LGRRRVPRRRPGAICNLDCTYCFFSRRRRSTPAAHLCPGYKIFFGHVDAPRRRMKELLASGRFADEITAEVIAEDAKRGRNDPCPCGNGQKWKRCHADAA